MNVTRPYINMSTLYELKYNILFLKNKKVIQQNHYV